MRPYQLLILWEVFPTARLSPQLNSYRRSSSLFPSSLRPVEILNVRNCVGVKYLTNCSSIWSSHHHDYPQNSTATDDHHHCYVIIATNINFDCSKLRWCEILLINLMITSSWFHHDYLHNPTANNIIIIIVVITIFFCHHHDQCKFWNVRNCADVKYLTNCSSSSHHHQDPREQRQDKTLPRIWVREFSHVAFPTNLTFWYIHG